jgi:hypothetical protein
VRFVEGGKWFCGVGPNQVFEISEKSIKICLGKGVRRAFLAPERAI